MAAARVIVQFNENGQNSTDASGNITLDFDLVVCLPGQPAVSAQAQALIAPTDSQAAMLTKITTAAVTSAQAVAAGVTVSRTDVLVESFTRGQ